MKKILLLLATVAFAAAAAQAQTTPAAQTAPPITDRGAMRSPEQQAQQAQRLAKELNLTTDQQTKVQQLMAAQRQETQTAIQSAGGNRRAMGQAMRTGRDKFNGQLKEVLTADQYAKYQQLMTERRAQLREHRQGSSADADLN